MADSPVEVVRLAEISGGAPYFARNAELRRTGANTDRDYYKLMLISRGSTRIVSRTENGPHVQSAGAGSVMLLRPFDSVRFISDDRDGIAFFGVYVSESDWRSFASLAGLDSTWTTAPTIPTYLSTGTNRHVITPFQTALDRYRDAPSALDLVRFLSSVTGLLFPSRSRRVVATHAPQWLRDALHAMGEEQNLREGYVRLLDLAHVSRSYLSSAVRRYCDATPTELVLRIRLEHAAQLLSTTDESIGSIAFRCGFENFPYFSTSFRRLHHTTPRTYRLRAYRGASTDLP